MHSSAASSAALAPAWYAPSEAPPDNVKQTRKTLGIVDMCPAAPGPNPGRRLVAIAPRPVDDISEDRQQEERLQAVIDSSPLALVEFGLDTRIRLWNPAAERIFGWTREEMLGRGGLPMAPPEKRAESEDLFERVRAGEWVNDYETVRRRKDGALVPVWTRPPR